MTLPELAPYTDMALLLMRVVLAVVFITSGWSHLTRPVDRAENIGMSPPFTLALGFAEIVAAASVALGIYPRIGAILLALVMLGAIGKKVFVWKTGLWGEEGGGWYYDLLYLSCALVVLTTGGGALRLV